MEWIISEPTLSYEENLAVMTVDVGGMEQPLQLYYKIDEKYAKELCTERIDAFLIPLLPKAMMWAKKNNRPLSLSCKTPVSKRLYHQLVNYYMPLMQKNISYYEAVTLDIPVADEILACKGAVGTGVSGGVDSSYTIAKYMQPADGSYKLTHGVFFNVGIYGGYDSDAEKVLERKAKAITQATGLEYICVQTNTCKDLYAKAFAPVVPSVFMGAVLALQKLFSVYYYSSGLYGPEMDFSDIDAAHFDWLNVASFSTQNTMFYSSGIEVKRLEKVAYIKNFPFTYDNLSVCLSEEQGKGNCGRCAKCTRTMAELESIGALDMYRSVFDVDAFRADPAYHWGYVVLKRKHDPFCAAILARCKAEGKKLPLKAYMGAAQKFVARGFTTVNRKREKVEK